jgi:hypothetical protein
MAKVKILKDDGPRVLRGVGRQSRHGRVAEEGLKDERHGQAKRFPRKGSLNEMRLAHMCSGKLAKALN